MDAQSNTLASVDLDYLKTTTMFGEVNRTILSKNFKGGKISNLFGETNLDFTSADPSGVVVLDISQAFGEINLTVPTNWQVESDLSQFCAATENERGDATPLKGSGKILVLTGNSVFAKVKVVTSK
jgi:predicted membrane protein